MRKFYKVSFEELSKHLNITKEEYEQYPLPKEEREIVRVMTFTF